MKIHYHASSVQLQTAQSICAHRKDPKKFDEAHRDVEHYLERRRPNGMPSRISSWFATDTPSFAARYLDAERREGTQLLYSVQMSSPSKHPMCVVGGIKHAISSGASDRAEVLAAEYWKPTLRWGFWEYLSPSILVLKQERWPSCIERALADLTYAADRKTLVGFHVSSAQ